MAQVLRLTPFSGARSAWGGQLVAAELAAGDADETIGALDAGAVATRAQDRAATLALSPFYAAAADRALGREHDWRPAAATLRDGLMAAITR